MFKRYWHSTRTSVQTFWQRRSRLQRWLLALALGLAVILGIAILRAVLTPTPPVTERQLPSVTTKTLAELATSTTVPYQAVVEPVSAAPLVARSGGRITGVKYSLGDNVPAGALVLEIDGRYEGNPTQAQAAGLQRSLTLQTTSEHSAITSAELAVTLAQKNVELAEASKPLNIEAAALARQQADLAVRNAELTLEDARDTGAEQAIRTADIAFKNARLAQDQATINRQLANRSQGITAQQARLNLSSTQAALASTQAQLDSQRQQLATQLQVTQAQLRQQQVVTPVSGEITRLNARVGDFVRPGETLGEVNGLAGAQVSLAVTAGVHDRLTIGQILPITTPQQTFSGVVSSLASVPAAATGLWQVDVIISSTPQPIHPSDIVTVHVPAGASQTGTYFVPLSALTIRQSGTVLFTISANNTAEEHQVDTLNFSDAFAEVSSTLPPTVRVVVEGNRTLQAGEAVVIAE